MSDTTATRATRRFVPSDTARTLIGIYGLLIVLLAAAPIVSHSLNPVSLSKTVVSLAVFTAVVAFGQFLVVLIGGLDLSIPTVMTIAGVVLTSQTIFTEGSAFLAIPFILTLGAAIGCFNGLGIVYFSISPVVMTLATNVIVGGAVLVYTNGTPSGSAPELLMTLTQGSLWGWLPTISLIFIAFVIAATILMRSTSFGRQVYAMGGNRLVAYLSGVAVNRLTITVYGISGLMAAFGGILLTGNSGMSYLSLGDPYLLLSLSAVILGGVSISGGRGSYVGVVGGALILMTISVIMSATSWPESTRQIVYAVIIIAAVIASRKVSDG